MKKRVYILACVILLLFTACTKSGAGNEVSTEAVSKTEQYTLEVPTPAETEPVFKPETVELIAVGDVLLHDNVSNSGKMSDGTYNYDHLFANVKSDVSASDIAIVNQEVILGGTELGLTGYPCFNGAYEVGDSLADAGFNVVLHATNHTLDRGVKAIDNCMNFWKTKHPEVAVLGINESQEEQDDDIYVYEQNGIRIAILNYTYGTNGIPLPESRPYVVNLLDEEKMKSDIAKAQERADFVIVCPHWGIEYTHTPSEGQKALSKFFLEQGVDLVIGAHPHYIQPVEMLTREDGHKMLVYYSLGNFINSTADSGRGTADRMVGGMAKVTITNDEDGNVFISDYSVTPLVTQMLFGVGEITTYKLSDYTEELAAANGIKNRDSYFSLDYVKQLVTEVFGDNITE